MIPELAKLNPESAEELRARILATWNKEGAEKIMDRVVKVVEDRII